MMDAFDLASRLFGNSRAESRGDVSKSLDILTATGAGDSSDGAATVYLDADVTPADDYDGDDYAIGIPTSPNVIEGDGVLVGLTGSGALKTPVVISNPGSGDRMQAQVDNAETLAHQVEAIAQQAEAEVEQVRQDVADFRDDVATTYATKVERQDGDDAVKTWVTTNYTNSNDLATTYATKTLVSQTKDAIELAASQTYETQTDAAATYATKSALTVGLDGIRSEVAEDYQPKGDYATTASMNSAIQQSASSIESSVAATYETKSDASATYATKTEVQQTASGLDTRITTAQSTADGAYLERTATGTTIDTTGAATIRSLVVEGQSVQDGTPTPSAPVPIKSVESGNLTPFFSHDLTDVYNASTNPNGYWRSNNVRNNYTQLEDGWAHFEKSGITSTVNYYFSTTNNVESWLKPSTTYTALIELRNVTLSGGTYAQAYASTGASAALPAVNTGGWTESTVQAAYLKTVTTGSDVTSQTYAATGCVQLRGTADSPQSLSCDLRISLYEGTYTGHYVPVGCVTLVAQSRNLVDYVTNYDSAKVTYSDGALSNKVTDSKTYFQPQLQTYRNGTLNESLHAVNVSSPGTYSVAVTATKAFDRVRIKHNGSTQDIILVVQDVPLMPAGKYCLSLTVDAANPSVLGGLVVRDIQLEQGSTATAYTPYVNSRTDIDLQGHALRSLPDGTHDEMAVDSLGRVTMTQRVGEATINGSEGFAWFLGTTQLGDKTVVHVTKASWATKFDAVANVVAMATGRRNVICDRLPANGAAYNMWDGPAIQVWPDNSAAFMICVGQSFSTSADFNTWLQSNPLTVLYPLATPQTIDLGTIDLPTPADTLWLDAAIVPTIEATWWTVDGIAGQQALDAEVTERQTLIRQFSGGVLAGYVGNAIAALVNAAGSFDVVRTAWSDGVPSILGTLARYAASGISLFDAAGNVLAEFASDHVRIGGAIPEDGSAVATVCFFDSDADKGAMLTGYVDQSGDATQQTQDTRTQLRTRTHDADMPTTYGAAGESGLDVGQWLHAETGSYSTVESTATLTATADSGTDPTQTAHASASLGVKAVTVNDSAEEAYLTVNGNDVPMEQAIAAFPVTLYDNASASASAAATLSETAANYSRLTIFFKDTDGTHGSVDVWLPDGKRVALPITWINGASTQEMYQRVRWVTISGTSISTYKASGDAKYRTGQVKLGATASVTNADYISIVHVIGYR